MEDEGPAAWGIAGANRDPGGAFTPTPRCRREWKAPPGCFANLRSDTLLREDLSCRGR